jgi:hypothetical protein
MKVTEITGSGSFGRYVRVPDRGAVTDLLDFLAAWALLQVLFVWCLARAARLREPRSQRCIFMALTSRENGRSSSLRAAATSVHRRPLDHEQSSP